MPFYTEEELQNLQEPILSAEDWLILSSSRKSSQEPETNNPESPGNMSSPTGNTQPGGVIDAREAIAAIQDYEVTTHNIQSLLEQPVSPILTFV